MMYSLPVSVEIGGTEYPIRSDYRAVLDICAALSDAELSQQEKAAVALDIFYPTLTDIPGEQLQDAIKQCFWFINCGDQGENRPAPKLMDWEQDFKYLVAPINRVAGAEIRSLAYMHWWTFISAYYEIGDCLFAQIIRIRDRLARGKPLDKQDREWYRQNRHLVEIRNKYTDAENELLKEWAR